MELFGLIFLVVALILIGAGAIIGLIVCTITAIMVGIGVLSSSIVIGFISRRAATGLRAFIVQCALIGGIPSGILCAWLVHSVFSAAGPGWLISFYGALGGAVAGLIIALLLDFIFRRLHRWSNSKLGRGENPIVRPV